VYRECERGRRRRRRGEGGGGGRGGVRVKKARRP
jgi:hypothetical protein